MEKYARALAAGCVILAAAAGKAIPPPTPLPVLIARSDLVVIGEVLEAGQPTQLHLQPPGARRAFQGWYRKYRVAVKRVLRDAAAGKPGKPAKPSPKVPAGGAKTIDVLSYCAKPQKPQQPGGLVRVRIGGPAFANLQVGGSYVLMLQKFPGKTEYFLPAGLNSCRRASDKIVPEIEKLADLEKWPWGKAASGLQIVAVPARRQWTVYRPRQGKAEVYLEVIVAVRNTDDDPVALNLYGGDKYLSLYATGTDKQVVKHDPYFRRKGVRRPKGSFSEKCVVSVQPGRVLVIGPWGVAAGRGVQFRMPLTAGKWQVQAIYESSRKTGGPKGPKLWTGTIASAPAEIVVTEAKGR